MTSQYLQQNDFPSPLPHAGAPHCETCGKHYAAASRELGSFVAAVRALFGEAEAARAAEQWVALMERMELPILNANYNWRYFTVTSARQLATRRLSGTETSPATGGRLR